VVTVTIQVATSAYPRWALLVGKQGTVGILILMLAGAAAGAHHGYTAIFDASKKLTLAGTLTQVDWRNPHIHFSLDAKSDDGRLQAWTIEAAPPSFFARLGVNKIEFQKAIGTTVNLETYRAKDGSLFGSLLKITFADGKIVINDPTD
jgi:hypothetical protein